MTKSEIMYHQWRLWLAHGQQNSQYSGWLKINISWPKISSNGAGSACIMAAASVAAPANIGCGMARSRHPRARPRYRLQRGSGRRSWRSSWRRWQPASAVSKKPSGALAISIGIWHGWRSNLVASAASISVAGNQPGAGHHQRRQRKVTAAAASAWRENHQAWLAARRRRKSAAYHEVMAI